MLIHSDSRSLFVFFFSFKCIGLCSLNLGEEISSKLWVDTRLNTNIIIFSDAAIAGVAAYNNHKLKKEASRASVDDSKANINESNINESELAESEPLVASSASSK